MDEKKNLCQICKKNAHSKKEMWDMCLMFIISKKMNSCPKK